jgi:hypothetical protein
MIINFIGVKNYTDMDYNQSVSPHGITGGCNATVQPLVKNKEDLGSPKESDSEFSAATGIINRSPPPRPPSQFSATVCNNIEPGGEAIAESPIAV